MSHSHPTMDEVATTLKPVVQNITSAMNMVTTMAMNHGSMDHGSMDHSSMDHGSMDHSSMDHGSMDHSSMDHSSMGHGSMGNGSMGHGMMQMYFHDGYNEFVLFKPCYTETVGAMVGACFAIFALAVLYEGLKYLREYHLQKTYRPRPSDSAYSVDGFKAGASQEHITTVVMIPPSFINQILSSRHIIQTFLHMIQVFISYCLMLVFMTYNVWLCLAVIVGAGVGYFLFGWKRAVVVDSNEHCH